MSQIGHRIYTSTYSRDDGQGGGSQGVSVHRQSQAKLLRDGRKGQGVLLVCELEHKVLGGRGSEGGEHAAFDGEAHIIDV